MYLIPDDSINSLEFSFIIDEIKSNCYSENAVHLLENLSFNTNPEFIEYKLAKQVEIKSFLLKGSQFSLRHFYHLELLIKGLETDGYVPVKDELFQLYLFLASYQQLYNQLEKNGDILPLTFNWFSENKFQSKLLNLFLPVFDENGEILDTASTELKNIRKSIKILVKNLNIEFEKALQSGKVNGWLSDEQQSVREGERVIAVQAKFKRKINGIVVSESGSGKTVFIQPLSVLELHNKLSFLKNEEEKEVKKILRDLAKLLSPNTEALNQYQYYAFEFDILHAKAKFALKINANKPQINRKPHFEIYSGRHPVLYIRNLSRNKATIPLDIELNADNRILVISGPNAGGKTICLKTIGLFQLMLQATILIPVENQSSVFLFPKIFTDIGDNQSIENDLSTYSAKLKIVKHLLENASSDTLFLMDEFGSGTEPQTGGLVAEVILDHLLKTKAMGVISTHYSNLKAFAMENDGIVNGAMLFDSKSLKPVYKLQSGQPGSSYTFEMIMNSGFDDEFIDLLKSKLSGQAPSFERILSEISEQKQIQLRMNAELEKKLTDADKLLKKHQSQQVEFLSTKKAYLEKAKIKAERYLENIENEFNKLLKVAVKQKSEGQSNELAKEALAKIKIKSAGIKKEQKPSDLKSIKNQNTEPLKKGDFVKLPDGNEVGIIESINKGIAVLVFDYHRIKISLSKLERTEKPLIRKTASKVIPSIEKAEPFSPILDIRGMRREEALMELEKFINAALLKNFPMLKIIHGKGNGILREAIRLSLRSYSFVKSIENEKDEHGGDGATIFYL